MAPASEQENQATCKEYVAVGNHDGGDALTDAGGSEAARLLHDEADETPFAAEDPVLVLDRVLAVVEDDEEVLQGEAAPLRWPQSLAVGRFP